jgi:TatD DNase family protein
LLADTHCHLDFNSFSEDLDPVLARARQAGVERILNPAIDLRSSRRVVELAEAYPEIYVAVGVHPNDALSWDGETLNALRELATHPKVVAIGEIGLDYFRDSSPHELQKQIFGEQLDLALSLGLPVVIHNRQASEDVLELLKSWCQRLMADASPLSARPGVLHSFSAGLPLAEQAIELGFSIGFTGPVTYRKAEDLRHVAENIPLERILIETDAPFLTPEPHRGRRNEPAYVRLVAEKIGEIRTEVFSTIAQQTTRNAQRLFGW